MSKSPGARFACVEDFTRAPRQGAGPLRDAPTRPPQSALYVELSADLHGEPAEDDLDRVDDMLDLVDAWGKRVGMTVALSTGSGLLLSGELHPEREVEERRRFYDQACQLTRQLRATASDRIGVSVTLHRSDDDAGRALSWVCPERYSGLRAAVAALVGIDQRALTPSEDLVPGDLTRP